MFGELLTQLPKLLEEKEPDLAKLLNPQLSSLGAEVTKPAILKESSLNLTSTLSAGTGLSQLSGNINLNFKSPFSIHIKAPVSITILVDSNVRLVLCKDGISEIKGLKVDGPGFLDPAITSAYLREGFIEIKVGPITQKISLNL